MELLFITEKNYIIYLAAPFNSKCLYNFIQEDIVAPIMFVMTSTISVRLPIKGSKLL